MASNQRRTVHSDVLRVHLEHSIDVAVLHRRGGNTGHGAANLSYTQWLNTEEFKRLSSAYGTWCLVGRDRRNGLAKRIKGPLKAPGIQICLDRDDGHLLKQKKGWKTRHIVSAAQSHAPARGNGGSTNAGPAKTVPKGSLQTISVSSESCLCLPEQDINHFETDAKCSLRRSGKKSK